LAEVGLETKFGQINSLSGHVDFFSNLDKKITGFEIWKGFGGDFEHLNIWIFEHLNR
jgi:hypothetical protein